jgi:polyisoprenyl-phosphate glycosyltransferase
LTICCAEIIRTATQGLGAFRLSSQDRQTNFGRRTGQFSAPLLSVVVPVFNEEDCLPALYQRLTNVLATIEGGYEIIFVNDGSRDRSLDIIRGFADSDPHVAYVSFSRNFGHEAATSCGLERTRGQAVVLIDADLQDPPEVILDLLSTWRDGYDVVYGQRSSRAGETWTTRATSHAFYRILRRLAPTPIPVDVGDFRLMDRAVVDAFLQMPERKRFVRGMIAWTGFRQTAVFYDRDARLAGETKYHFANRLGLAIDAIASSSVRPLRWIMALGAVLMAAGCLAMFALTVMSLFGSAAGGQAWLASAMTLLSGVQTLSLGVVGEYVGRTHLEAQGRPLYLIAEEVEAAREVSNLRVAS